MENVKKHFEEEAKEFDDIIWKVIPYYDEMLEALISAISFPKSIPIKVIDIGCGTGTISNMVLKCYPNAQVTCLDIAENMVEMAKLKLSAYSNVRFITGDITHFDFDDNYDVAISSLALHHLLTDKDKKEFYKKIYKHLNQNGIFYNADVVLASSENLQKLYIDQWKRFMARKISREDIENRYLAKYYEEDKPSKLVDQLTWLFEIGFVDVDVIWKYYNLAVYGGVKI